MELHLTGALGQLWLLFYHFISYGLSFVDDLGWGDLVRVDAAPTMHILAPIAVAILLMPVVVRWSGGLLRLAIVCMALLVPVWVVLPAL